jgi:hypothetical protein
MNIDVMIEAVLANLGELDRMALDWRDETPDPELRRWMHATLGAASREQLEELAFKALFDRLRDRLLEEEPVSSIHSSPLSPNYRAHRRR